MTTGMSEPTRQIEKQSDYKGVVFIAEVVENNDPEKRQRVRIKIPEIHGDANPPDWYPWAVPCGLRMRGMANNVGSQAIPIIGAEVYVVLQNGDPHFPLYIGGVVSQRTQLPQLEVNYPFRYGMQDDKGNYLWVDTQVGDIELYHFSGLKIRIEPTGQITIDSPSNLIANFNGHVNINVVEDATIDARNIYLNP